MESQCPLTSSSSTSIRILSTESSWSAIIARRIVTTMQRPFFHTVSIALLMLCSALALPAQKSQAPLRVSEGVENALLLTKVMPAYPFSAKRKGVTGLVQLNVRIDEQGSVERITILNSPDIDLSDAAITAVLQWKYKPFLLNGEPTAVDTTVTINFSPVR